MLKWTVMAMGFGLMATPVLAAGTLRFEPSHTSVIFQYAHFGLSHPSGKIMGAGYGFFATAHLSRKAFGLGN
jgi:polyisoprenoid-binding protein YceI